MSEAKTETPALDEQTERRNFYSDAVRAGLHAAAADMFEQFKAGDVADGPSCVLAGACQFLAELYEGMATKTGADKEAMKKHMLESVGLYFDTYAMMTAKEKVEQLVKGGGTVQ